MPGNQGEETPRLPGIGFVVRAIDHQSIERSQSSYM
jgi:hypothetical protein